MILMQQNIDNIKFITGNAEVLKNISKVPVHRMLDERVIEFLGALSSRILKDKRTKEYPDVISYAFWIRKSSLMKMKKEYNSPYQRIGRGVALHIAPSNVPVNFAVSFTSALLAGNASVVRVSNKEFVQVDIIADALNALYQEEYADMEKYLVLIRYEHSEEITQMLTDICDLRIIWGGNQTINIIRKAKLPPRAIEMAFSDRHSLALINADEYLKQDPEEFGRGFYTDTYYTDQNACSSPRIVIWMGQEIEKAKTIFWKSLQELVKKDYDFAPILAIDKLNELCRLSAHHTGIHDEGMDNVVKRVKVDELTKDLMDYKTGGGYFFEYDAKELRDIIPLLSKACQTISYFGVEPQQIAELTLEPDVKGIDRVVPIGHTMDLAFIWDGYHMIETMTRIVYIV